MKRIIIISVSVICVAMLGIAIAAGPGMGGWHRSPEKKVEHIKAEINNILDLDEAQKTTLDRIASEIIAEHQQMKSDCDAFKASFKEMFDRESVSAQELQVLFETKKPEIENLMLSASEHIAEFHSVLTPEQRATLIAEMDAHQGRRCRFMR